MRAPLLLLGSLLLLPSLARAIDPPPSAGVRIYRCVGANGAVSLQDAPCTAAHRQQVLDMVRPKDPPPRPLDPPPPPTQVIEREVRVTRVQPPQPMYECVTAEGQRYTSDSAEGNPRWVPAWTYGYLPSHGPGPRPPGGHPHPDGGINRPGVIIPGGSVMIRDSCHALPPQEVCARLRDSRWDLVRRYNSALQSERQQLVREQRGIEARLNQDCGGW